MDRDKENKNLSQQIEALNERLQTLSEKQNAQYTNIILRLRELKTQSEHPMDIHTDNELYREAKELVIDLGFASTSLIQRFLKIGYARTARIMDLLEEEGVVGPGDGANPREVLMEEEDEVEIKKQNDADLYDAALKAVTSAGKASTSYLQRRLKIGYSQATRLMNQLEANGIIGPAEGAKPREVFVKKN